MSRTTSPEPALPADDADADFDAWTLDELDDFADPRSQGMAAHDADN